MRPGDRESDIWSLSIKMFFFSSSHDILELERSWRSFSLTPPLTYRWDRGPIEGSLHTRGHTVTGGKAMLGIPASPVGSNLSRIPLQGEEWRVHTQKQCLCWSRLLGSVSPWPNKGCFRMSHPSLGRAEEMNPAPCSQAMFLSVWSVLLMLFWPDAAYLLSDFGGRSSTISRIQRPHGSLPLNPSAVIRFLARPLIQEENKSGSNICLVIHRTSCDLRQIIGPNVLNSEGRELHHITSLCFLRCLFSISLACCKDKLGRAAEYK